MSQYIAQIKTEGRLKEADIEEQTGGFLKVVEIAIATTGDRSSCNPCLVGIVCLENDGQIVLFFITPTFLRHGATCTNTMESLACYELQHPSANSRRA
jgi:hypothetical protein